MSFMVRESSPGYSKLPQPLLSGHGDSMASPGATAYFIQPFKPQKKDRDAQDQRPTLQATSSVVLWV
jgi:hypothetical protein